MLASSPAALERQRTSRSMWLNGRADKGTNQWLIPPTIGSRYSPKCHEPHITNEADVEALVDTDVAQCLF
jgi:hypothetical protein